MGRTKGSKNKVKLVLASACNTPVRVGRDQVMPVPTIKRGRGRPKGSPNKSKLLPKTATLALGKVKTDGCYVCGRVSWGPVQPLGLKQWRHAECYPGSPSWITEYPEFDPSKKSEAGQFIYEAVQQ